MNLIKKYSDLTELLRASRSDKMRDHDYGIIYDLVFNTQYLKKGAPLDVLEIGVAYHGPNSSSHVFCALDIVGTFVGIDIQEVPEDFNESDKWTFIHGDAYTPEMLDHLQNAHKRFDIIIDDGDHWGAHQDFFLREWISLLYPGGILLCEDVNNETLKTDAHKWVEDYGCKILQLGYNKPERDNENIVLRTVAGSGESRMDEWRNITGRKNR